MPRGGVRTPVTCGCGPGLLPARGAGLGRPGASSRSAPRLTYACSSVDFDHASGVPGTRSASASGSTAPPALP